MKLLVTLLTLMSLNAKADNSCDVCFHVKVDLSMFYVEIDPISECTAVSETIEKSCQELALSIGSEEDPFRDVTVGGNKVPLQYTYQVTESLGNELSAYFSELSSSKPNISYKKESNRLYSTFVVRVE